MLTMTNAVGRTWSYSTTPSPSVSSTPLGNTTTSTRTSYGLPGTTTLPGGATTGSTFDGNTQADESSRFPLTRTDVSGRERQFAYDALGGLDSVTDLSGAAASSLLPLWFPSEALLKEELTGILYEG